MKEVKRVIYVPPPPPATPGCINRHKLCNHWAESGECEVGEGRPGGVHWVDCMHPAWLINAPFYLRVVCCKMCLFCYDMCADVARVLYLLLCSPTPPTCSAPRTTQEIALPPATGVTLVPMTQPSQPSHTHETCEVNQLAFGCWGCERELDLGSEA
jgi:hypothetical protein